MAKEDIEGTAKTLRWPAIAIAIGTAVVVVVGARLAVVLSQHMMNAVALVGSWLMLALLAGYLVTRFRPAVGIAVLAGFGVGAVAVAVAAGMGMMG